MRKELFKWDSGQKPAGVWTDYSAISTITGWSSFTTKQLDYMLVMGLVFVRYVILGTSNVNTASFTLASANAGGNLHMPIMIQDNGVVATGRVSLLNASSSVILRPTIAGATNSWTASGTKGVWGQFWYVVA